MTRRPRIVISLGDPCGIGPEILLRSLGGIHRWADVIVVGAKAGVDLLEPLAPGDPRIFWQWAPCATNVHAPVGAPVYHLVTSANDKLWDGPSAFLGHGDWIDPTPDISASHLTLGEPSAESGRCAVEAVRFGAEMVMNGHADALVTLPLAKNAAHMAGYAIPGHTEFLQELSGTPITRMAFVSPTLCVVLHTVHQSLRSVVEDLDAEAVAETLTFSADRFIQLTGKQELRVALCALNPHGGEEGAFGDEEAILNEALTLAEASFLAFPDNAESRTPYAHVASPFHPGPIPEGWSIFPVNRAVMGASIASTQRSIEVLRSGHTPPPIATRPAPVFSGPFPADSIFLRASRGEFDLVVALYHDQGLIPIKVMEPFRAVNLTLGLPFIRTSPDHGTAFDKAGCWTADPTNFLEATALAVRLAGRARQEIWHANVGEETRP